MDWTFYRVDVNIPRVRACGCEIDLGIDCHHVVIGTRSADHFSDGSVVVVVMHVEGGGGGGPFPEVEACCALPLVDEQDAYFDADGVVVGIGHGGGGVVELVACCES